MGNSKHYYGFISQKVKKNKVEMLFEMPKAREDFLRWLLMYADFLDILEPKELYLDLNRILRQIEGRINLIGEKS